VREEALLEIEPQPLDRIELGRVIPTRIIIDR